MATAVKLPTTGQSTWIPAVARAASAVPLLIAMTSSEVPTATGIGKDRASTRAGTRAKPPPTPKNPVSRPTAVAVATNVATRGQSHRKGWKAIRGACAAFVRTAAGCRCRERLTISVATISMSAANPVSSTAGRTCPDAADPRNDPTMPSAPKVRPCPSRTLPRRAWGTMATSEAAPTMSRELVVASCGASPTRYTNAGTVRMDPPPPSAPSDTPMSSPTTSRSGDTARLGVSPVPVTSGGLGLGSAASEEATEQRPSGGGSLLVGVAEAAVGAGDAGHDLTDVLATAGPGGLAAYLAPDGTAHAGSPSSW
jgi:hypothetical protein